MGNLKLQDDNYCFVCGKENHSGLKLTFNYSHGKITCEFIPSKIYQGYKDIIHGGIITTVLDEAMIQAAISEGIGPVTAEICVRFKKPLMVNDKTLVEAEIVKRSPRLITAKSRLLIKESRVVIAEAEAKLIPSQ